MRYLLICLLAAIIVHQAASARILAVLPMPARSHHNMLQAILKTLAERGHQVVNYSPFPLDKPMVNYKDVHLDNVISAEKSMTEQQLMEIMNMSPVRSVTILWSYIPQIFIKQLFENKKFKELLESDEKFDLVFLEVSFAQEVLIGLGHRFQAPVVSMQPFGSFSLINKAAGNSLSLAYIPDYSFSSSDHMSFYERFLNAYSILGSLYEYYTHYLPVQEKYMRKVFNDPTMPSIVDMIHNISLFVNNAHPNVHYSQPYTPNLVPIGGIHISRERKPLPQNLQSFLDEAKHGVIYFALGSFLPDHLLPQKHFDNFINVFRRLPQRVLWKTQSRHLTLPDNVMTAKWVPQQDVLAHPNVLLFMTHGGLFSQHEAIYAGVPVVCTPYFGDQPLNSKFYEEREIGVKLPFNTLSEETIYSAITTVLNNSKYKENMQRLSQIYKDRPLSPADTLMYWVEYVLRHKGAHHLRPTSATLSWYQLALLDVLGAVIAAITTVLIILYLIFRKIFTFMKGKKHVGRTLLKKKN